MIKSIAAKLSLLFLLTAITTCYYERETDTLKVCFIRDSNIWTMDIDGSNQKQITFSDADNSPSWSPDGEKIIFHSSRNGQNEIFLINPDGSSLRNIFSATGNSYNPTWSADGKHIIFARQGVPLCIIIADTDGQILQSFPQNSQITYPILSPDDNYLYFRTLYDPISFYRINLKLNIQDNIGLDNYLSASFSPDGKTLACENNSEQIYLVPTNDLLTPYPQFITGVYPCWTPDGKTIVYVVESNIYSINIDGTNQKPLTTGGNCSFPCVQGKPR